MIRRRRQALGLTQDQLAEQISGTDHVTQTDISRIELGKVKLPHYERLERIGSVLDLPLGELLACSGWAGAETAFAGPAYPLLDHLIDACYVVDRDWRFTYVNQRAADLAGQTAAAMRGTVAWGPDTAQRDAPVFAAAQRAFSKQIPVRIEHYDPSLDTWFESNLYPGRDGVMVLTREISTRYRTELDTDDGFVEQLPDQPTPHRSLRDDTQRYADVGHELQCLATMIVGSVQLFRHHLNAGHAPDSRALSQCLDTVEQAATRVSDRLDPLMQTSAHRSGMAASRRDASDHAIRGHHEFLRWRRDRHAEEMIVPLNTHQPDGQTDARTNDRVGSA
jgi:transcriptional regulator with XRE-family HTH domain